MVNPLLIRSILGIIGNVTSFCLFCSPAPTIWRIFKNKSVEEFKFHPIVAGIINCFMWVFYSMPFVHPHSILVTTVNSVGLVMYICYNLVYLRYANNQKRKSMFMYYVAEIVFLAALICITLLAFHTHTSRSTFVGIFCDVFGIILYGAPLTIMIGNGVGALLAVAQLILYACYYGSTPKEGKLAKDPVKPTAPQQVQMMTVSAV